MRKTNTGFKAAACLAVSAILGGTASAQIVYDNTSNYLGQRTSEGNAEVGDVVQFAGTARNIAAVSFEYFVAPDTTQGTAAVFGNETAQFFMYALGANGLPTGSAIYSSPTFNLVPGSANGYGTATISGLSVTVPDRIAWTVAINGIEGNEQAGLLFYNPPSVGSSPTFDPGDGTQHDFILRHNVSGWQVLDNPGIVDNLNIRFTAVPEPTTIALMVGGLLTMGLIRRRNS